VSKDKTKPQEDAGFLNRWSARKRQESTATKLQESSIKQSVLTEESSKPTNPLNTEFVSEPASAAALVTIDEVQNDEHSDEHSGYELGAEGHGVDSSGADTRASGVDVASIDSEDKQEPALLSDEDMPALETLTAKSDLSDFFNKGVSASLRRAALRRVFSLPVYNIRDGLNDYDDDYTKFEPLGDTITSDMKWHKARKEREEAEAEERRLSMEREAEEEAAALEQTKAEADQKSLENKDSQDAIENDAESHDGDRATEAIDDRGSGGGRGGDDRSGIHAGIDASGKDASGKDALITGNHSKNESNTSTELKQTAEPETTA